jgi:hypothetical protein
MALDLGAGTADAQVFCRQIEPFPTIKRHREGLAVFE